MIWLAIYLAGFGAINILTWLCLRREPTAHGKIVGTQIGFWLGLLWPLALIWFTLVGIGFVANLAYIAVRDWQ